MAGTQAGWYDDGSGSMRWWDGQNWTDHVQACRRCRGLQAQPQEARSEVVVEPKQYLVRQFVLEEKLWNSGLGNLAALERMLNEQAALGYRLHTMDTPKSAAGASTLASMGFGGPVTLVFERIGCEPGSCGGSGQLW